LLYFLNSSRPKKTQVVNHGMSAESLGMFPYPSSDGTSSAVSRFVYTLKLTQFSLLHDMWPLFRVIVFCSWARYFIITGSTRVLFSM